MKIVGISGSFRKGLLNTGLLRAASSTASDKFEILNYSDIGLYNGDDEAAHGIPERVQQIAGKIAEAGGVLISTPEYNHSVPGDLTDDATREFVGNLVEALEAGSKG